MTTAQFARAYLVGQIHADFLDSEKDLASTARNSVLWDADESAGALQDWGQKVLRWAFEQWVQLRRQKKETEVIKAVRLDAGHPPPHRTAGPERPGCKR